MEANGVNLHPTASGVSVCPDFLPTGGRSLFIEAYRKRVDPKIYVVPFDGGTPVAITDANNGPGGDWDPTWSADGNSIIFGDSPVTAGRPDDKRRLHVIDLRTRKISDLAGSAGMWSPHYSHDGRFLVGMSAPGWKLMLYEFARKQQTQLSNLRVAYPNWSPDDKYVYFATFEGNQSWWRVRVRDRRLEHIKDLKDLSIAGDNWFAVTPNNSLVSYRDLSSNQIYALDLDTQ